MEFASGALPAFRKGLVCVFNVEHLARWDLPAVSLQICRNGFVSVLSMFGVLSIFYDKCLGWQQSVPIFRKILWTCWWGIEQVGSQYKMFSKAGLTSRGTQKFWEIGLSCSQACNIFCELGRPYKKVTNSLLDMESYRFLCIHCGLGRTMLNLEGCVCWVLVHFSHAGKWETLYFILLLACEYWRGFGLTGAHQVYATVWDCCNSDQWAADISMAATWLSPACSVHALLSN